MYREFLSGLVKMGFCLLQSPLLNFLPFTVRTPGCGQYVVHCFIITRVDTGL